LDVELESVLEDVLERLEDIVKTELDRLNDNPNAELDTLGGIEVAGLEEELDVELEASPDETTELRGTVLELGPAMVELIEEV
jgi:hypothetical protein